MLGERTATCPWPDLVRGPCRELPPLFPRPLLPPRPAERPHLRRTCGRAHGRRSSLLQRGRLCCPDLDRAGCHCCELALCCHPPSARPDHVTQIDTGLWFPWCFEPAGLTGHKPDAVLHHAEVQSCICFT